MLSTCTIYDNVEVHKQVHRTNLEEHLMTTNSGSGSWELGPQFFFFYTCIFCELVCHKSEIQGEALFHFNLPGFKD